MSSSISNLHSQMICSYDEFKFSETLQIHWIFELKLIPDEFSIRNQLAEGIRNYTR